MRNGYNQVPCLTRDTTWESDKNTIKHHKQEPRDIYNTNDPQKKYHLGTVSKDILMEGLSHIGHIGQASFFGPWQRVETQIRHHVMRIIFKRKKSAAGYQHVTYVL